MPANLGTIILLPLRYLLMAGCLSALVFFLGIKSLIIAAGGLVAVAVLIWPQAGLAMTIVAVMNLQTWGKLGDVTGAALFPSIAKIMGALTLLAWLFNVLRTKTTPIITWQMSIGASFVALCAASLVYAPDPTSGSIMLTKILTNFMLYFLIANLITTITHLQRFTFIFLITGLICSSIALYQYFSPASDITALEAMLKFATQEGAVVNPEDLASGNFKRPSGTVGHHNWLSLFMISVIPLSVVFLKKYFHPWVRIIAGISLITGFIATVLTHDKLGLVGLVFIVIMVLSTQLLKINRGIFGAAIFFGIISFALLPDSYKERVLSIANIAKSESTSARLELQRVSWDIFIENPLLGVGYGNYGAAYMEQDSYLVEQVKYLMNAGSSYQITDIGAHNMYLEVLCETGIIGLTLCLLFFFFAIRDLLHAKRLALNGQSPDCDADLVRAIMICLSAFIFGATFLHGLEQKPLWILLGFSVAALRVMQNRCTPAINP